MSKNILILGVNGFIGSALTERILKNTDWYVYGMDMATNKLENCLNHERFRFVEGDITINKEWIDYHIKKCDVVLPLVAIANPAMYVKFPLRVFELDFEANLSIVRKCVQYKKRIIFPSTSEVYGMCEDAEFDEELSNLVLGPINKQRWIYSCSKQLIDRVIYAYGVEQGLDYTLFRPFNWLGPKLDELASEKEGSSRAVTQIISDVIFGRDVQLVDGGRQRRSFTFIEDGVDALMKIIENKNNCATQQIFNIGNPENDVSIKELAGLVISLVKTYPAYKDIASKTKLVETSAEQYFGKGYEDVKARVPSIQRSHEILGWMPQTSLKDALKVTLDYHLCEKKLNELAA